MNQVEKTEIILGTITTVRSRITSRIFVESEKKDPDKKLIEKLNNNKKEISKILNEFYYTENISDTEYLNLLKKINSYE